MASTADDWEVERIGPPDNKVRVELGEDGDDDLVRLTKDGETVTFRVEKDVARPIGRDVPDWAYNAAERLGARVEA